MKTRIMSMLAVFGIVAGLSFDASAQFSVDYWVDFAKKGANQFCAPGGVSIRRASGVACKVKLVAALAVYLCYDNAKNKDGFRAGQCYGNAEKQLGAGVDTGKAKELLLKEAQSKGEDIFNAVKGLIGMK